MNKNNLEQSLKRRPNRKSYARGSLAMAGGLSSFMGSLQSRRPWSYIYWIAPHGTEGRVEYDGQGMKRGGMGGVRLVDSVAGESWPVTLVIVIS